VFEHLEHQQNQRHSARSNGVHHLYSLEEMTFEHLLAMNTL
jgi:hypothetical protein